MVAVIEERRGLDDLRTRIYTEWETRTICQFVAATVPVHKGKENKLLSQATEVSLMHETEKAEIQTAAAETVDNTPFDPEDEEAAIARAAEGNKAGSFEKATRGMVPKDRG